MSAGLPAVRASLQPEPIHWTACTEPALIGLDCGTLTVPLDHARPGGRQITLALSRSRHTGPAAAYQGVLLANPGGPGAGGRGYGAEVAASLPVNLRKAYDVIGFDPRGVGASNPALSCDKDYFKPVRPDYVPRDTAAEQVWLHRSQAYARACGAKYGTLLDHMKTTDSAQDLESIRVALGQQKINYLGASYGTYLGAVYATLFPGRVRRMVLDSNVRPGGVWYGDNVEQDYAFDASLKSFFAWTAAHDQVYGLGTTQDAVEHAYYALRTQLAATPAGGLVGPDELDDTVQIGAYLAAIWPALARALSDYSVRSDPSYLIDRYQAWGEPKEEEFAVYNAVQCTDARWPTLWETWRRDTVTAYAKAPYQAWDNAWYNAPCLYWPAAAGRPIAIKAAKGLPGVLLFQATLDAATPFAGGLEMHRSLAGSRLVIEDGGRTHAVVQRGNTCIDDVFNAYLATGRLPRDLTHCPRLPDPDAPPPGTDGQSALRTAKSARSPDFTGFHRMGVIRGSRWLRAAVG